MSKVTWDVDLFAKSEGRLLRRARNHRGWSQRKLADAVGINQGTLSLIENGKKVPNLMLWAALYEALGYIIIRKPKEEKP